MKLDSNVKKSDRIFDKVANAVTSAAGSPITSVCAFLIIIVWAISGPFFHFSDTWQLVINTSTTIITFLMVFVIQQSQNKDTIAIQMKLNELIAANNSASNQLIDIEDMTENELKVLKKFYVKLSERADKEDDITKSHSLAEADRMADEKSAANTAQSKKRK